MMDVVNKNLNPKLDPDGTLPKVPGWVAITEAGDLLGVTRQHAYRMARERTFRSLARLGDSFTICVAMSEIDAMVAARRLDAEHEAEHEAEPSAWAIPDLNEA